MVIILTIGCIDNNEKSNEDTISSVLLTITFDDYKVNYTLNDIEILETSSGAGGYIKTKLLPESVVISDIIEYKGVSLPTLLDKIPNIPDQYNISVVSDDGYNKTFSRNETLGYVDVYNENGDIISNESAVMILAYKENDLLYSEFDSENIIGPLRIALIGDDVITSSNLWLKMVVSIEILQL